MVVPFAITLEDFGFSLSNIQKEGLISYINSIEIFKKDEENRQEQIKNGANADEIALPQEYLAVMLLRGGLEDSIK